ncbi:MAG: hypothetical protein WCQ95_12925 [Bacteroidota bacterium]
MKKLIVASLLFAFFCFGKTHAQYITVKTNGGSVVTDLGNEYKVNNGSTLKREWYTMNYANCPVQLKDIGIQTAYDTKYMFTPKGDLTAKDSIVAYEVHHVLYDMFGRHIFSLRNFTCRNIIGKFKFNDFWSWAADLDGVSEYLICVSYVAYVRTADGKIWRFNPVDLRSELSKLLLPYEESYSPKLDTKK